MSAPISREVASVSPSTRTTMRWLSTKSTVPERRATTTAPESRAVMYSMPVPTNGARARSSGTAWRCMFDPISARFASSFSRNGTSEAATETSCFGETSMKSTLSRGVRMKLPAWRALTRSVVKRPFSSTCGVGLRDDVLVLFPRRQVVGDTARTRGRGGGGRPCSRRPSDPAPTSSASTMSPTLYFVLPPALAMIT